MSKRISLTRGQFTIVDDEDYKELNQFNWHAHWCISTKSFYVERRRLKRDPTGPTGVSMHRFIMDAPKGMQVDHINHDTLDNRKDNLRICTVSQNAINKGKNSTNKSGHKGVCWHKRHNKWIAQIRVSGRILHLGYFLNKEIAAQAYKDASRKYHGEFVFKEINNGDEG